MQGWITMGLRTRLGPRNQIHRALLRQQMTAGTSDFVGTVVFATLSAWATWAELRKVQQRGAAPKRSARSRRASGVLGVKRGPDRIYCRGFAGVPGLTPECFFACAISSRTLSLPS